MRRLVLFLVALAVALAGTGAVFVYVSRADARAMADQQPVEVLVAVKDVPAGTTAGAAFDEGLIELQALPRIAVPRGAAESVAAFADNVAETDLRAGELVLRPKFISATAAEVSGALPIPGDKLAVSISVEDPARVGGYVVPGAEVALFNTFNVFEGREGDARTPSGDGLQDKFDNNRATRLVLARVQVLAVSNEPLGREQERDDDEAPAAAPANIGDTRLTLTLAVTQAQAEKVIQVAQTGHPWFALLSKQSKTEPSEGIDNDNLFKSE